MISRGRRSLLLALLLLATLLWSAVYSFDVPPRELAILGLYSALGIFTIMLGAALCVALLQLLKAALRRMGADQKSGSR